MYLNPKKSRVSNVDEILNKASLQLKGIINVGTSENDLGVRKSKRSDWQSIDDISDISISEDSSEAKPKRTNRFMKKKKDNDSISKPFRTDHFANEKVEKSVNSHANTGQNNIISSSKLDANKAAADDLSDLIDSVVGLSDSEASKRKNKFIRNESIVGNKASNKIKFETKETLQKKTLDHDNSPITRNVNLEATSTFKKATSDFELQASIDEVVEGDLNVEHENVSDGKSLRSNAVTCEEIKTKDNNDSYNVDEIDEDDDIDDDDIFGNIQADSSELIKAFETERDTLNNVGNNRNDDNSDRHPSHHLHQSVKQTSKAAFTFNASVCSSKLKEDPFYAKVKVEGQSRSPFRVPKDEKKMQQKKKATRNDYDYDDDDVIEEESIRSYVDDLSSVKTETYSSSAVGRSKSTKTSSTSSKSTSSSESSSSRSSTSKGSKISPRHSSEVTRANPRRSPTRSSTESYTNSFASYTSTDGRKQSQKRLINTGIQTGLDLNMNENHWLFDGHQSFEFKFKDVERKFLTSREGINSLMDLTSFTPAMSCLNNIIKQQVGLLATFVAIQKSLHKQIIESTNRKAPYSYTTLSDKRRGKNYEDGPRRPHSSSS